MSNKGSDTNETTDVDIATTDGTTGDGSSSTTDGIKVKKKKEKKKRFEEPEGVFPFKVPNPTAPGFYAQKFKTAKDLLRYNPFATSNALTTFSGMSARKTAGKSKYKQIIVCRNYAKKNIYSLFKRMTGNRGTLAYAVEAYEGHTYGQTLSPSVILAKPELDKFNQIMKLFGEILIDWNDNTVKTIETLSDNERFKRLQDEYLSKCGYVYDQTGSISTTQISQVYEMDLLPDDIAEFVTEILPEKKAHLRVMANYITANGDKVDITQSINRWYITKIYDAILSAMNADMEQIIKESILINGRYHQVVEDTLRTIMQTSAMGTVVVTDYLNQIVNQVSDMIHRNYCFNAVYNPILFDINVSMYTTKKAKKRWFKRSYIGGPGIRQQIVRGRARRRGLTSSASLLAASPKTTVDESIRDLAFNLYHLMDLDDLITPNVLSIREKYFKKSEKILRKYQI